VSACRRVQMVINVAETIGLGAFDIFALWSPTEVLKLVSCPRNSRYIPR
jgi:hypothetical protein